MNGTADEQCILLNSNTKSYFFKERQHMFVPITDTTSSKLLNYDNFNALCGMNIKMWKILVFNFFHRKK